MKRINIVKYSIVAILISLVFIFISCKKSTADILSDALALDKLNNYQLTMNISGDFADNQTYKIIKDANKFDVTPPSYGQMYYVLNDNSYDIYYNSSTYTQDGNIYTSDDNFRYYCLCFYQIDTVNSTYDENSKTYNLNIKKDNLTIVDEQYVEEGSATLTLENNRIVKFSYDITVRSEADELEYKFTIDGTIAYDKIDVTIPDITA